MRFEFRFGSVPECADVTSEQLNSNIRRGVTCLTPLDTGDEWRGSRLGWDPAVRVVAFRRAGRRAPVCPCFALGFPARRRAACADAHTWLRRRLSHHRTLLLTHRSPCSWQASPQSQQSWVMSTWPSWPSRPAALHLFTTSRPTTPIPRGARPPPPPPPSPPPRLDAHPSHPTHLHPPQPPPTVTIPRMHKRSGTRRWSSI